MIIVYILFILVLLSAGLITFIIITLDSFKEYNIRINEAEANIEATLNKRFDLLNKSTDIIKKELNTEQDTLKTIEKIRSQKLDNFELDKELYCAIEEFHDYSLNYENFKNNDDYTKTEIKLIESESEIIALKKYYNDIIDKYNDLVNSFPSSLIAKIKKFHNKKSFELEEHSNLISLLKQKA